jgi:hypothetical protein
MRLALACMLAIASSPAAAQTAPPAPTVLAAGPVTVESYYRIRWGSFWDFMEIYQAHHAPVLAEMQRLGFITSVRTETPVLHIAGDQRWDLRVTITYRNAAAASEMDPAYDRAAREASERLFKDRKAHLDAETRRFAMIEEHWDVIVAEYAE